MGPKREPQTKFSPQYFGILSPTAPLSNTLISQQSQCATNYKPCITSSTNDNFFLGFWVTPGDTQGLLLGVLCGTIWGHRG